MTVGKVIRKCRKIRKMSLTELGKAAGFTKGADVRISQYQADRAVPTTAIKKRLASALGISKYALSPPSLTSNIEIMHTLFKLDDKFPLYIGKHNNLSLIHISEPTRRTPISYAVFCLKKKKKN